MADLVEKLYAARDRYFEDHSAEEAAAKPKVVAELRTETIAQLLEQKANGKNTVMAA